MRLVFLDSRDLIDCVEHADPCDYEYLARWLRKRRASLVYTLTNVIETMPRTRPIDYAVEIAHRLDYMPHIFIRHSELSTIEFKNALSAFATGRSSEVHLPLRETFWRLLPHPPDDTKPATSLLHRAFDQMSMAEQLRLILMGDEWIDYGRESADELAAVLEIHRQVLGSGVPNKQLFRNSVASQLDSLSLTVDNVTRFADWLFREPSICAAWRFGHEAFQEMRRDRGVAMTRSDLQDFTHVYLLPYVSAATLDAQWRDYCRRAGQRLGKIGIELPYLRNLCADTTEVLNAI